MTLETNNQKNNFKFGLFYKERPISEKIFKIEIKYIINEII